MNVKEWLHAASNDERALLVKELGTSMAYLWQIAGGHRKGSPEFANSLQAATTGITPDRIINREDVLPDIFKNPAA